MLEENKVYQVLGQLTIRKSRVLNVNSRPNDDKVNWLFIAVGEKRFSFVYKINKPDKATYDAPFEIKMAFTIDHNLVKSRLYLNHVYEISRGEEIIGSVRVLNFP